MEGTGKQSQEARECPLPGDQFGAYRAVRLLGQGGMGAVYLAERIDGQFTHRAALKVMAAYLAGPDFLRKFESERQLLASLNHNNITRLLDGGMSSSGTPYLLTEFVDGQALDEYCDARRLNVEARIRLFLQVCEAVDYAHRNLIVHRDLKPGNIMVSRDGVVKLLDFGTASILADGVSAVTRMPMFTPRYASPEQLRGQRVAIATDIYSLGVILYELLAGAWPFGDPGSITSDLSRATGDVAPSPPSVLVTEEAAARRSATRDELRGHLRGDLLTILRKMLESEPARRYDSARQVADDLERYLDGRPILARPQTRWYAARKFARRNWAAVSASAVAILMLIGMTLYSVNQARRAREEAARARRISEFTKNTFLSASATWSSPLRGQNRAIEFTDILDNAAERVGPELGIDPAAEADIRGVLGSTYGLLGDASKGEPQIRRAIQLLEQSEPAGRKLASLKRLLCNNLLYQGRYTEALSFCQAALAVERRIGAPVAGTLHDTAFLMVKSGAPLEDAEVLYREALGQPPDTVEAGKLHAPLINTRIGAIRNRIGDLDEGDRILAEAERVFRTEPGPPIEIIPILFARAYGAKVRGDYERAGRILTEALDMLTRRPAAYMGRDQLEIELAAVEALEGKAGSLARLRAIAPKLNIEKAAPIDRVRFETLAGTVEARSGLNREAEAHLRDAIAVGERETPRQACDRVEACVRLFQLLRSEGRMDEAAKVAAKGLETARLAYGTRFDRHPFVLLLSGT